MFKDYYLILGIGNDATPEEIEKAFKAVSEKYNANGCSINEFKNAQEAFEVLSNQEIKLMYDKELQIYNESNDFLNYEIKNRQLANIISTLQSNLVEKKETSSGCYSKLNKGCLWIIIIFAVFLLQMCFKIAVKQRNRGQAISYIYVEPSYISLSHV